MSQHRSLRGQDKDDQQRSVLKRYERIRELEKKDKWQDGDSVFGLAKLKIIKFKIKKEKAAPVEGAEGALAAEGAAGAVEGKADAGKEASAASAKGAQGGKPASGGQQAGKTQSPKKEGKK